MPGHNQTHLFVARWNRPRAQSSPALSTVCSLPDANERLGWEVARDRHHYGVVDELLGAADGGSVALTRQRQQYHSGLAQFVTQAGVLDSEWVAGHIADTENPGKLHMAFVKKSQADGDEEEGDAKDKASGSSGSSGSRSEGGSGSRGGSNGSGSKAGSRSGSRRG